MIKFDCGRAPGPEKRIRREPDEVDRAEAKVGGLGAGGLDFSPIWRPGAHLCWAGVGVLPAGKGALALHVPRCLGAPLGASARAGVEDGLPPVTLGLYL